MSTLDEIAARDARWFTGSEGLWADRDGDYAVQPIVADRRYLLGLVREARETLTDIGNLVAGDAPLLDHYRQEALRRAAEMELRLTEGSDRT